MAAVLVPGTEATVHLVKSARPDVTYPATVVSDDGEHAIVWAAWSGAPAKDLGLVRFERGDILTEHYWRHRWYAVKEVRDARGRLKGWYCDVTRPAQIEHGTVVSADLYLDLWLSADGRTIARLDEDEFVASGLPDVEPETARCARDALDELERLARTDGLVMQLASVR